MIVSIGNNDIFVISEAESVRRVKLPLAAAQLAELEPYVHGRGLGSAHERRGGRDQRSLLRRRQQRPPRGHAARTHRPDAAHTAHTSKSIHL